MTDDKKLEKKHWLKRAEAVLQKTKFGPKYKWFKVSYLEFFFWIYILQAYNFFIRPHVPVEIIRVFSLISDFLVEGLKASKKDHSCYNTVSLKTSLILWTLTYLPLKKYALATLPKAFLTLQIFQQTCFCLFSEKAFALHHFLTPKNCIIEALWKQCLYISVHLRKKMFVSETQWSFIWSWGRGGELVGERLNNFLKATCCLSLVKCFTIFHFNLNFWKFNYFSAF